MCLQALVGNRRVDPVVIGLKSQIYTEDLAKTKKTCRLNTIELDLTLKAKE